MYYSCTTRSCLDETSGEWTYCHGGTTQAPVATLGPVDAGHSLPSDITNVSQFFADGEEVGSFGLKYTCVDLSSNRVSRCRTITSVDNYRCSPSMCGPTEYESESASEYQNRVCTPLTECSSTAWENAPPTYTSDRSCMDLTNCVPTVEYELVAPSATSDRTCKNLTVCDPVLEYEKQTATYFRDRVCAMFNVCPPGYVEWLPPTPLTDRICKPETPVDCVVDWANAHVTTLPHHEVCANSFGARHSFEASGDVYYPPLIPASAGKHSQITCACGTTVHAIHHLS